MGKRTFVFDDFSAGERGSISDWKKIPHSFRANNMLVYETGEIGPRAGLEKISVSGLSNGVVWGYGSTPITGADRFFIQGTAVRTFSSLGNNLQTASGSLDATPTRPCPYVQAGDKIYFTSYGDGTYMLEPLGPTLTKLTSVSGLGIAKFGERILLSDISGSFRQRVRFSDALDYTSWPAENFFDTFDDFSAAALFIQRGNLIIGKQDALYMLSGVPGVNATLRKLVNVKGPVNQFDGNTSFLDTIYLKGLGNRVPTSFNGAVPNVLQYLNNGGITADSGGHPNPPAVGFTPLNGEDNGLFIIGSAGENKGIGFVNGVWTYHSFDVDVSAYLSLQGVGDTFTTCDGGSAGAHPNFYNGSFVQIGPGVDDGANQRAGDNSSTALDGTLTLPIEQMDNGDEIQVQEVIVDFRVTNTKANNDNGFDLKVKAFNRRSSNGQVSATHSFTEAPSLATGDRTRRFIAGVGDQGPGNAFQLLFTNIVGVSIQKITVIAETESFRGTK